MATRTIGGIEALKAAMTGAFVRPDDLDHEQVRNVWMAAMINHHPAVIVRCATAQDAAQAIRFAQNQGLELVVRSGAHSAPGLRDLDAATQRYGLAVPAGLVSHTGVADLTVGGGMGWLIRQAGLSIDNLVSAEVVVADGKILRATEDDNPHLFWAIRGGGGNFGVVTELEFRLHDVDPVVQFGLLFWDAREGEQALRLMRDTIADLPRTLNAKPAALTAPPAPFVPPEHHNKLGYALLLVGFADGAGHQQVLEYVRNSLPPLFEYVTPMPYVALQQLKDEANAWGFYGYDKGAYVEDLSDGMIRILTQHMPRRTSPLSVVLFYRLDGAYSEANDNDTAFDGGRSPCHMVFIIALTRRQTCLRQSTSDSPRSRPSTTRTTSSIAT